MIVQQILFGSAIVVVIVLIYGVFFRDWAKKWYERNYRKSKSWYPVWPKEENNAIVVYKIGLVVLLPVLIFFFLLFTFYS